MLAHGTQLDTHLAIGAAAGNGRIITPSVAVYAATFEAGLDISGLNDSGNNSWPRTLRGGLRRPIKTI